YNAASSSLTLTGTASVDTTLMRVFGKTQMPISTTTTVTWGLTKLRVALVLDNTGSMNETDATGTSKISALKTASHQFLTTMQNAGGNPGDIQVAIIPFNTFVKVDPTVYKNKPWVDWSFAGMAGGDDNQGNSGCDGGDDNQGDDPCHPTKSAWNGCFT